MICYLQHLIIIRILELEAILFAILINANVHSMKAAWAAKKWQKHSHYEAASNSYTQIYEECLCAITSLFGQARAAPASAEVKV